MRTALSILCLLAVAALFSCGTSRHAAQFVAPPAALQSAGGLATAFPRPSTLPRTASGPPTQYERLRAAKDYYNFIWPEHNIFADSFYLYMSPNWDAATPDLAAASYATYSFNDMAGYTGKQRIRLLWSGQKPAVNDVYVAIANVTHDRWDWVRVNGNYDANFTAPYSEYTDSLERMFVVVLLLGKSQAQLESLLVGDTYVQSAGLVHDLNPDPQLNIAPLTVNFIGNGYSAGSFITAYDWDWDSDGTYDALDQPAPSHTFAPGNHTVTLRATDGEGATLTDAVSFVAVNPANSPPTAFYETADPTSGAAPLSCHFDASGSSDSDGSIILYEWDFDGDQVADYSSTDPTADYVFAQKGPVQVTLRVTDNDLAVVAYSTQVTVTSGWTTYVIDTDVGMPDWSSGASLGIGSFGTLDPRVGVAYRDEQSNTLRFAKSSDDTGSSWSWIFPVPETDIGYSASIAKLTSGLPMIAYGKDNGSTMTQYVVSPQDETAATWNAPISVAPGVDMGSDSSLAVINVAPAIAARIDTGGAGTNKLVYVPATTTNGSTWAAPITIVSPGNFYIRPRLGICASGVFNRPALTYNESGVNGTEIRYVAANDIAGATWPAPYPFNQTSYYSSLNFVDGRPAWVCGLHSVTNYTVGLQYCRAEDEGGMNWPSATTQIGSGGDGELVVWNGKPAVVFVDVPADLVQLAVAQDADGTAWDKPYNVKSGPGIDRAWGTVLDGNLVIVYYNTDDKDLIACFYE